MKHSFAWLLMSLSAAATGLSQDKEKILPDPTPRTAEILKRFTHNDRFGGSVTLPAGSSRVEPGAVPASDLTLSWPTFSDAANQAGMSRRYGGIHFEQGDLDARATGRVVARLAWQRAQDHWDGG